MAINVGPGLSRPNFDLKLSKGGDEVGLKLYNKRIERAPFPRTGLKFSTAEQKYADAELPFRPIVQETWEGGRGLKIFEDDNTRYADGFRVDTVISNRARLAGQETYCKGYRNQANYLTSSTDFVPLVGATEYLARSFVADANYNSDKAEIIIRKHGAPAGDVTLELCQNNAGNPGAVLKTATFAAANLTDTLAVLVLFDWAGTQALVSGTTYWVKVYHPGAITDYIELGCDPDNNGKKSADDATWLAIDRALCFRITDADNPINVIWLEYKQAWYVVTQPDNGGHSYLYLNGWRGAADSNVGNLNKLLDAVETFTSDAVGGIVLLTGGPGSEESQPWRQVVGYNTHELIVSPDWNIAHTTATNYVVLGTNLFTQILDLGGYVTDAVVLGDFIYFARGETSGLNVLRYEAYNNAGAWADHNAAEQQASTKLLPLEHPNEELYLVGSQNVEGSLGTYIWLGQVPRKWGDLYQDIGTLVDTDTAWADWVISNVTNSVEGLATRITVGAGFATGIVAVKNLDDPVDITRADYLAILIMSTVNTNAGDLQLLYDDQPSLGKAYSPNALQYWNGGYADMAAAHDGDAATNYPITWTTTDYVYVMFNIQFNKITVDLGATVNAIASVLSAEYWNGAAWAALTISDGTDNGGATFGKDGDITFTPPFDWDPNTVNSQTGYHIRLKVSVNLTAGVTINEITVTRKNNVTKDLPALAANQFVWAPVEIDPKKWPLPDETSIKSLGINVAVDNGAQVIYLWNGVRILSKAPKYVDLPNDVRVTGMAAYSGGAENMRRNPWIFTDRIPYEIQTENNNQPVELNLDELKALSSYENGIASCVNNVYLFFNVGEWVEKYYNHQLNDVGPNRDEGLPEDRRGVPYDLITYPDKVIAAINAKTGISSVLMYSSDGWHEVYRAPRESLPIRSLATQEIPYFVDRLWISQGSDILWVPIARNPETEFGYKYTYEGALTIARIYGSMRDVDKFWNTLKLGTEKLAETVISPTFKSLQAIKADYRLSESDAWTELDTVYKVSPFQEVPISTSYNKYSKWIDIRLRFQTNDQTKSPVLISWVLETLMQFDVKFAYTVNFVLADDDKDLLGEVDPVSMQDKLDQLDTWAGEITPIYMESNSTVEDKTWVKPQASPVKRLGVIWDEKANKERHQCQVTLIEI